MKLDISKIIEKPWKLNVFKVFCLVIFDLTVRHQTNLDT